MIPGIIASLLHGFELLFSRFLIAGKHVKPTHYVALGFFFQFIFLLPGLYFFDMSAFSYSHIPLFLGLFLTAALFNICMHTGLKTVQVERAEPFIQSKFIITVALAVLLFPDERNFVDVILALLATATLLAISIEKKHMNIGKGEIYLLAFAVLVAVHDILAKALLQFYSPYTFLTFRVAVMAVLLLAIYRPVIADVDHKKGWWFAFFGIYLVVMNLFLFWSISTAGVVFTSLLLSISPLIAIWFSKILLKEKIHMKNIFATIVILCCIVISLVL